eukprot:Polyplicarium_translucidae@DN3142_c0_g1_i1.p1
MKPGHTQTKGTDMLIVEDGRLYHLGAKEGEVAPRIVTVGSHARAELLSSLLKDPLRVLSKRGFLIFTGTYQGTLCSVIAIGMGAPMIDFMMREATHLMPNEPMAIVRVGTCGVLADEAESGDVMIAKGGSFYSYVDYGKAKPGEPAPYGLAGPEPCSDKLTDLLAKHVKELGAPHFLGLNCAGETFFACQGRKNDCFNDDNSHVLQSIVDAGAASMEMESHQLFFLANRRKAPTYAAACHIGVVHRHKKNNVTPSILQQRELEAGEAALKALADMDM